MNETPKPFDRHEAFGLIAPMLQVGLDPELAIKASIEVAQLFEEKVREANPLVKLKDSIRAVHSFGSFAPNGGDLYWVTNDGVHGIVASFPNDEMCVLASLAMNNYISSGVDMTANDTPDNFFPDDCSHLYLGGEES